MGLKESGLRGSLRNVSVGIDAIPDRGLIRDYDARSLTGFSNDDSVSTFADNQGNEDLSGTGTFKSEGINGLPAVESAGDEEYTGDSHNFGENLEYTLAGVAQIQTVADGAIQTNGPDERVRLRVVDDGSNFEVDHPGSADDGKFGNPDTNPFRYVISFDGSTVFADIDGTNLLEEDFGTDDGRANDYSLGGDSGGLEIDILLGRHLSYSEFYDADGRSEIDSALKSHYNL